MGLPGRAEDTPGCLHLALLVRQAGTSEQGKKATSPPRPSWPSLPPAVHSSFQAWFPSPSPGSFSAPQSLVRSQSPECPVSLPIAVGTGGHSQGKSPQDTATSAALHTRLAPTSIPTPNLLGTALCGGGVWGELRLPNLPGSSLSSKARLPWKSEPLNRSWPSPTLVGEVLRPGRRQFRATWTPGHGKWPPFCLSSQPSTHWSLLPPQCNGATKSCLRQPLAAGSL